MLSYGFIGRVHSRDICLIIILSHSHYHITQLSNCIFTALEKTKVHCSGTEKLSAAAELISSSVLRLSVSLVKSTNLLWEFKEGVRHKLCAVENRFQISYVKLNNSPGYTWWAAAQWLGITDLDAQVWLAACLPTSYTVITTTGHSHTPAHTSTIT